MASTDPSSTPAQAPAETSSPRADSADACGAERPRPRSALRARLEQDRAGKGRLPLRKLAAGAAGLAAVALGVYLARAPLLRVLAQRPDAVGGWALGELVEMRDPGSFGLFVERFLSDTETFHRVVFEVGGRAAASELGALAPDDPAAIDEHRGILVAALTDRRAEVRAGALRALFALKDRPWTRDPVLLEEVAAILSRRADAPAIERRFAAFVLRAGPTAAIAAALRQGARDPDRQVRRIAVEALGATPDPEDEATLRDALRDEAPEVARAAHLALARRGADVALETLVDLYDEDRPGHRQEVLRAVAGRPEPAAEALLLRGLEDAVGNTRLEAVAGLRAREGASALEGLCRALSDLEPSVRLAAAEALASRPDARAAAPRLVSALARHEGWEEVRTLHDALSRVTGVEVAAPRQGDRRTWVAAIEAWREAAAGGRQ